VKTSPQCMSSMPWRSIVLLLLVVLPLTRVATAWGEAAPPDTSAVEASVINTIAPVYTGSFRGNANRVSMANSFSNKLSFSNGLNMTTQIRVDETNYRDPDRDRKDQTKDLSHNMFRIWSSGLSVSGMLSENRLSNRIVAFGGDLQNFIVNTKQASANATYDKSLNEELKMNASTDLRFFNKEQEGVKTDKSLEGSAAGGFIYRHGDRFSARARGFFRSSRDRTDSHLGTPEDFGLTQKDFERLGLSQDSLSSVVSMQVTDSTNVGFEYIRYNGTREYIDLPRGTFLQQDITGVIRERQLSNTRIYEVKADLKPVRGLEIKMNARHSDQANDFAVEQRKSSRTVGDYLTGNLTYELGKNTTAKFNLERREVMHDMGLQSLSNYNEESQNISATLRHSFTSTFYFNLVASTGLSQSYYTNADNPRDRDQLNQKLSFSINSKPYSKLSASISMAASSIEFVNIHASLSGQNRKETTYDFRPNITFQLNDRIQIKQDYGLNFEFTEYTFDENANDLDRNVRFANTVRAKLSEALNVEFFYDLQLHDAGSYLRESPGAERALSVDTEDRKDRLTMGFRYKINSHLTAIGDYDYSRRVDKAVATNRETEFADGGIAGGLEGDYKWEGGKTISFSLLKVKRYGRFNTDLQNDYWEMNSQIKYSF
jgi:hypothetical protein